MSYRYADYMVRRYIKKRGVRIPEDRLYSAMPFMAFIAACMLVYGWTIKFDRGGIPLAVVILFLQGFAQLFCFPSLNTYCLDVMPKSSGEVVAGNYVLRYLFACASTGAVLPAINAIGVGWFSTISCVFMIFGCLCILATITWGRRWRESIDGKKRAARLKQREAARRQLAEVAASSGSAEAKVAIPATETRQNKEEV